MSYLEVNKLCYSYNKGTENEVPVLDDIDLTISRGEFVAIIGTNGSGKSTLAKHFNAILQPDKGKCLVAGMDTSESDKIWDIRQHVGMVFQNPDNQIIAAVVEDDVAFGPENLGVPSEIISERVKEALTTVRMSKFKLFSPHLLSGGQKQRVAIAGALAMQTECLVLDEPTAMLDPLGRQEVMETIKKLHAEQGITIILITHFMDEAAAADRVLVMDKGKIIMDDTPRKIFAQTEKMKQLGLGVPLAADVAFQLRKKGIKLPENILTDEDLVVALCQ